MKVIKIFFPLILMFPSLASAGRSGVDPVPWPWFDQPSCPLDKSSSIEGIWQVRTSQGENYYYSFEVSEGKQSGRFLNFPRMSSGINVRVYSLLRGLVSKGFGVIVSDRSQLQLTLKGLKKNSRTEMRFVSFISEEPQLRSSPKSCEVFKMYMVLTILKKECIFCKSKVENYLMRRTL